MVIDSNLWAEEFQTDRGSVILSKVEQPYIVLFFYPKDDTPGCTIEVQEFRDQRADFDAEEVAIFGVSRDGVTSHQKFVEKFSLNFPLIADTEEHLCKAFDVIKEKNVFGKIGLGIERSTFILNRAGEVLKEWRKVTPKGHAEEVLEAIKALKE